MKTIYWSYKIKDDLVIAIALYCEDEGEYAMNANGSLYQEPYKSVEQAIEDITQIRKQDYYKMYGSDYELKYVEPDSDIWLDLVYKFEKFKLHMINIFEISKNLGI